MFQALKWNLPGIFICLQKFVSYSWTPIWQDLSKVLVLSFPFWYLSALFGSKRQNLAFSTLGWILEWFCAWSRLFESCQDPVESLGFLFARFFQDFPRYWELFPSCFLSQVSLNQQIRVSSFCSNLKAANCHLRSTYFQPHFWQLFPWFVFSMNGTSSFNQSFENGNWFDL